jgi:hypothetical protein
MGNDVTRDSDIKLSQPSFLLSCAAWILLHHEWSLGVGVWVLAWIVMLDVILAVEMEWYITRYPFSLH